MVSRHQMALCVAAVVLLLTASTVHGSGRNETSAGNVGRIVGGQDAAIERFPWVVSLEHDGHHKCGGSVLTERWVLTAAHCFKGDYELLVRSSTSLRGEGGLTHSVKRELLHERYYKKDPATDYDIAVLEVDEPFVWTERLQPVRGLATEDPPVGSRVVVTGWGQLRFLGPSSNKLQQVAMSVVDWNQCRSIYQAAGLGFVTRTKICTLEPRKGDCMGDSGGPVIDEQTRVQVGIVSTGHECANEFPNLETSVAVLRDWIRRKTGV